MLAASFLAIFLMPVMYYVVEKVLGKNRGIPQAEAPQTAADHCTERFQITGPIWSF